MHAQNPYLEELQEKFEKSNDIEEIRLLFNKAYEYICLNNENISFSEGYILLNMMNFISSLTEFDFNLGKDIIVKDIIPALIDDNENIERVVLWEMRKKLVEWINFYEDKYLLRENLLDFLGNELKKSSNKNTLWTISSFGFRNDAMMGILWDIVLEKDNEFGDACLSVVAKLRSGKDDDKILEILQKRSKKRRNHYLYTTLARLSNIESLDILFDWIENSDDEENSYLLQIISDIADKNFDDIDLQDKIWRRVIEIFKIKPLLRDEVYLGTYIGQKYNTKLVTQSYLDFILEDIEDNSKKPHDRYLIYLRLSELIMPQHIIGWTEFDGLSINSILLNDFYEDTKTNSRWSTQEQWRKEGALNTLLRLGNNDLPSFFENGIEKETSKRTQYSIMNILSCFRFDKLPSKVLYWVTDLYDGKTQDSSGEFIVRMNAIQTAQSTASIEAFDALVNFGFTFNNGNILQKSAAALSEVALWLIRNGHEDITDRLVDILINSDNDHQRSLVAETLVFLAGHKMIPDKYLNNFLELLEDENRDDFELSLIVQLIGLLPYKYINPKYINKIAEWATHSNSWIQIRSLETLVLQKRIDDFPNILSQILGIDKNDKEFINNSTINNFEWKSRIISLMAIDHQVELESIILSILKTDNIKSVVQVLNIIPEILSGSQYDFSQKIESTLIERVYNFQNKNYTELELFNYLSKLFPSSLPIHDWDKLWNEWHPNTRAELADALGHINHEDILIRDRAINLLLKLTSDGQYGIRRASYRALSRLSSESLQAIFVALADSPIEELRRRAAEAWGWLAIKEEDIEIIDDLYRKLLHDNEATVRESIEKAWKERRERLWANQYTDYIQSSLKNSRDNILPLWNYGEALSHIADDDTESRLEEILEYEHLSPNIRYWIQRIKKASHERWQKVIKEWPEPWNAWDGVVEEGFGDVSFNEVPVYDVSYSLWYKPASSPTQKHEWGGIIWSNERIGSGKDSGTIDRGDGQRASFLITNIHRSSTGSTKITFVGKDEYPFRHIG